MIILSLKKILKCFINNLFFKLFRNYFVHRQTTYFLWFILSLACLMFILEMLWNLQQTVGSIYLVWALFSVSVVMLFTLNMARFICLRFYSILFRPSLPIVSYVCVWKDGMILKVGTLQKGKLEELTRPHAFLAIPTDSLPRTDLKMAGLLIHPPVFLFAQMSISRYISYPNFFLTQKAAHCRYSFELCGFSYLVYFT